MKPDLRLAGTAVGCWVACLVVARLSWPAGAVIAAVALVLAMIGVGASRLGRGDARWVVAGVLAGVVCGATATAGRTYLRDAEPIAGLARDRAAVTMTLTVAGDPHRVGGGVGPATFAVDASASDVDSRTVHASVSVRLFVLASHPAWGKLLPGQRVRVSGHLAPPQPGDLSAALLSTNAAPTLLGRPPWTQRAAGTLRAGLERACAGLPDPVRGLLPGLVDGDTTGLDPTLAESFRATGMTHLLAVSGANVAMVLGLVVLVAQWCRAGPRTTSVVCAVALTGFVILVRPSPSVLRAAATGALGLIALATGRGRSAVPALAAGVCGVLVYDPALAADIGFGLSVCATAGLLLIAPRWREALRARRWPGPLADSVAVAGAAQLACTPLIAGLAGTVSLVAVPANLLAEPAVPVATVLGVSAAVLSAIWPGAAAFVAWLASWPARWLIEVATHGAAAPYAQVPWAAGWWGAFSAVVVLLIGGVALRRRAARVVAAVGVTAALVGVASVTVVAGGWPPANPIVVACDVGQGDGLVLPTGGGAGVVVDTGIEPPPIDACLRRLGITAVPLLVLTHFHADHVGGLAGVLHGRRVGQILVSPFDEPPEGYAAVLREAGRIPISVPALGAVYTVNALTLTVLGPITRVTGTRSDPNNNSLILRADEAGIRVLLTGDAEIEEQTEVLATDGPDAVRADVLKQPHHGSAYSSPQFLDAVRPRVVLVSVGAGNSYGLPSLPTLQRLAAAGARVMRTDQNGDIAVAAIHGRITVTYRGHPTGVR